MKLTLATRRSPLARWQANAAKRLLTTAWSGLEVELCEVVSAGDRDRQSPLASFGSTGIFSAEVDEAVLEGRADVAVHSLKDLTTTLPEGMQLACCLPRGPVEDAWICPSGWSFDEVPEGARVATASVRRRAMMRSKRPDLEPVDIRGNVDTRLKKLADGAADAMILACAGLVRLELSEHITHALDPKLFLPAVGQGLVGLTCREGDDNARQKLHAISDLEALHAGLAERALLGELRGGCNVPVGGHARVVESTLSLEARVLSLDGRRCIEGSVTGARDHAEQHGRTLARDLLARGAAALIEEVRA